jgi:formylglycine-generating enzyme required for sulfatase activity/tRNA A-37 threonylcarbamoyl transferase component Bud32
MGSRLTPGQIPFQSKKYEWIEYLGGNMADVYLAREIRTEREVIVKILKAEYCGEQELQLRFAQEARLACQCQHPNIVATFYADEEDGRPYIAMEHLGGETIRALIQRGGIETQEQSIWIGLQLALALGYLQTAQIVHRDLKPDNVVVDRNGCAKLLDFGVARLKDSRLTEFGVRIGTLKYMSPEQVKSEPLTFSSDMYAFGVLLFEVLTFKLPYQAESVEDYFGAILRNEPNLALLAEVQAPAEVIALIKRCLEKEPDKRFASFAEISGVLQRYVLPGRLVQFPQAGPLQEEQTVTLKAARKSAWPMIGVAIAIFLLLSAGIAFWLTRRTPAPAPFHQPELAASEGMALVASGVALLGADAKPQMVKTFYIDLTEVTNESYLQFCRETGHGLPAGALQAAADYPVVNVSFDDAQAFAHWAHKRLPSANEWEKAARGSQGRKFPWGDEWLSGAANIASDKAAVKTAHLAPAASFRSGANPAGLSNMIGNAWEWVNAPSVPDDHELEVLSKYFSPPLSRSEPFYETRGGSFKYLPPKGSEAALTFDQRPMPARTRQADLGFRCAKDP